MSSNANTFNKPIASLIIKAGLIAGTLDILAAFIYYYIKTGKNPLNILGFVSKVALGATTFTSTALQQVTGLLVHFTIAFGWAIIFFFLYPRLKWMQVNKFFTGIVYGIFVWTMMNVAIMPAWNHKAFEFKPEPAIINCLILIVAIGMPLSFIASKQYLKKS